MAIENKYGQDELAMKSSLKYAEEHIEEGDPTILRSKNDNQRGRIFPTSMPGNQILMRESNDEED